MVAEKVTKTEREGVVAVGTLAEVLVVADRRLSGPGEMDAPQRT